MLTSSIVPVSALSAFAPSASATSLASPISMADAPTPDAPFDAAVVEARVALLQALAAAGYRFVTPTPVTHERVLARPRGVTKNSLLDVFGWNRAFALDDVPRELLALLRRADLLTQGSEMRSLARVASLGDDLFLHSGFPTSAADAVFFGPDTYRFARLVRQSLIDWPRLSVRGASAAPLRLLDVGCGSGAGAIASARTLRETGHDCAVTLTDINPAALAFAQVNARAAGIVAEMRCCDGLHALGDEFDLIITNPPYLIDDAKRVYRHGGDQLGRALSVRLVRESLTRLARGGRLVLYTGAAIVHGADALLAELRALLADGQYDWTYEEIDPDVFGEELQREAYRQVDRIAVVGLIVTRRSGSDHAA
ncbi:MAG: class I SAM-dependent methyltransferase [Pseudomonadota bacterium]|nr:class I SAM-dependent methyltransferase [Pseudomonadota bacterium]